MATCKECLHHDACKKLLIASFPAIPSAEVEKVTNRECDCKTFKQAADVVEVVRCKDCKFWIAMDDGFSFHNRGRTDGECEMLFERHYSERHLTGNEHFCSYGERKAGNEKGAVNGSEEVPGENQEN